MFSLAVFLITRYYIQFDKEYFYEFLRWQKHSLLLRICKICNTGNTYKQPLDRYVFASAWCICFVNDIWHSMKLNKSCMLLWIHMAISNTCVRAGWTLKLTGKHCSICIRRIIITFVGSTLDTFWVHKWISTKTFTIFMEPSKYLSYSHIRIQNCARKLKENHIRVIYTFSSCGVSTDSVYQCIIQV